MFKKTCLALLLAPMASVAIADTDGPNPGDDNPGSTTITQGFTIGAFVDGGIGCFETSDWCNDMMLDAKAEGKGKKNANGVFSASAVGYASLGCQTAAMADGYVALFFEGGGELNLTRHGNHGSMHHIKLNAGLESGSLSAVSAGALASAWAEAGAMAVADAESWENVCVGVDVLDVEQLEFCANALAMASAGSSAYAFAGSYADSYAAAASGGFGAVSAYNEVWGANIEEYRATLVSQAGSFAIADSFAYAEVYAEAFADAWAEVYTEACASGEIDPVLVEACSDSEADVQVEASALAWAYAAAQANAMAETAVEVMLPVIYKNENGINDTIVFGPDETTVFGEGYVQIDCVVPQEPEE